MGNKPKGKTRINTQRGHSIKKELKRENKARRGTKPTQSKPKRAESALPRAKTCKNHRQKLTGAFGRQVRDHECLTTEAHDTAQVEKIRKRRHAG